VEIEVDLRNLEAGLIMSEPIVLFSLLTVFSALNTQLFFSCTYKKYLLSNFNG
jgi:hypothetical protein